MGCNKAFISNTLQRCTVNTLVRLLQKYLLLPHDKTCVLGCCREEAQESEKRVHLFQFKQNQGDEAVPLGKPTYVELLFAGNVNILHCKNLLHKLIV